MLAQAWRWQTNVQRCLAQLQRKPQQASPPGYRMLMLEHHAVVEDLWVSKHLRQVENGAAGDALSMQNSHPVGCRPLAELGIEAVGERVAVRGA